MTETCRVCGQPLEFLDEPRRGSCGPCFAAGLRRWRELLAKGAVILRVWPRR